MLDRQIHCYSVDTGNFYTNHERRLHNKNAQFRKERRELMNKIQAAEARLARVTNTAELIEREPDSELLKTIFGLHANAVNEMLDVEFRKQAAKQRDRLLKQHNLDIEPLLTPFPDEVIKQIQDEIGTYIAYKSFKTAGANRTKEALKLLIENRVKQNIASGGKHHTRVLNEATVGIGNVISVFESSLNRTIGAKVGELTEDLITIQIYYFELFRDLVYFGFDFKGEHYVYFSSSAGQIRTKKAVFIKESTWLKYQKKIMCGLTIDTINLHGGCNVNKMLAYLALQNSATDVWDEFDIDKTVVIDDFETEVPGVFDNIDDVSFKIERVDGKATITHTDGAGMMLPKMGNNRMVRAPWVKGLLGAFDFRKFIEEYHCSPVIKDIYGKEHDLIAEDIEIIFTKSQFKMYKYYNSWDEYKQFYHENNCETGYCNLERDHIQFNRITYQMLQSFTDYDEQELDILCDASNRKIDELCLSAKNMLAVFGVTPYATNLSPLQEALKLYPELLNDEFMKRKLRDMKNSLLKDYRSGKLEVRGKYTFVLPDFFAACQHWFLGEEDPDGLLRDGEVFTRLFQKDERLDCLRSPHLYQEHAVRYNLAYTGCGQRMIDASEWFQTNAVYTSCHDLISRILQFDCDGDMLLVIADENIVRMASRNMRGIVPLYYEMKKAGAAIITNESIFDGLISAFKHSNIGIYSNSISKIKNAPEFYENGESHEEALVMIKYLCMLNNFCIDAAKTLYMPECPPEEQKILSRYTSVKLPAFFEYAKDKRKSQVLPPNMSLVNRLRDKIKDRRIDVSRAGIGELDYTVLMADPDITVDRRVVDAYLELSRMYNYLADTQTPNEYLRTIIVNQLETFGYSDEQLSDMLVKYAYGKKSDRKSILWLCFGDIILANLKKKKEPGKIVTTHCVDCGALIEVAYNNVSRSKRCDDCQRKWRSLQVQIAKRNAELKDITEGIILSESQIKKAINNR